MTLTVDMLSIIECEAAAAPVSVLDRSRNIVRHGIAGAPPDAREYGQALLLKLDHLIRCQRVAPARRPAGEEYLAPWITLSEAQRVAA